MLFMAPTNNKGYSLIELMATVVILGVITAASIPMFSKHRIKASLNEVMSIADQYKQAIEVYANAYGRAPTAFNQIGLPGGATNIVSTAPNLPLASKIDQIEMTTSSSNPLLIIDVDVAAIGLTVVSALSVLEMNFLLTLTSNSKFTWTCYVPSGASVYAEYLPKGCTVA